MPEVKEKNCECNFSNPDQSDIAEGSWSLTYGFEITTNSPVCAASTVIEGIDVSRWQGTIDWVKVAAAGKRFVFIRATDGTSKD